MRRSHSLCALLMWALGAHTLSAQKAHDSLRATIGPSAPSRVGRYMRGQLETFSTPAFGVAYQYSAGDSTLITVYIYPTDHGAGTHEPADATKREIERLKKVFALEWQRGIYDAYEVAYEGSDSVRVGGADIPGYRLVSVYRSRGQVYVSLSYAYHLPPSIVKVRATMPHSLWHDTDVPAFAHELVSIMRTR